MLSASTTEVLRSARLLLMLPSWVVIVFSRLVPSEACCSTEFMLDETLWSWSAADEIGAPMEAIVFPTDVKGLNPATEMLERVWPTPVTVELMEDKLLAMLPVNCPLLVRGARLTLAADLREISVTCVEFMAP